MAAGLALVLVTLLSTSPAPEDPAASANGAADLAALVDCPPTRAYSGEAPIAWFDEPNGCTAFCEGHYYDAGLWHGSCWYYPTPTTPDGTIA